VILGAGLLLLLGLGLLVAGVVTGVTALYWACVAACLVAAALLVLVRRQMAAERATAERVMTERGEQRVAARPPSDDEAPESRPDMAPPPLHRAPDPQPSLLPPAGATARVPEAPEPELRYAEPRKSSARETAGEPPLEEVEVTDLLLVMDLRDEVLVIDEHPRYHLSGCPHLAGAETFPLPIDEARSDGFTPCGSCSPDRHLAQRARERKAGRRS
jgi:hypothetical protein